MERFKEVIRSEGLSGVIKRGKSRVYKTFYILKAEITTMLENTIENENFVCRVIDEAEIEKIAEEYPEEFDERKKSIFLKRIKDPQHRGIVVQYKNDICGYLWSSIGSLEEEESGYQRKLQKNEMYLYDLYTFKKYRRQGVADTAFHHEMRFYKNRGYQYALDLVDESNKPSMSAMNKMGFSRIGKVYFKNWNGKKYNKVVER